jgi:hypothetical protein
MIKKNNAACYIKTTGALKTEKGFRPSGHVTAGLRKAAQIDPAYFSPFGRSMPRKKSTVAQISE